VPYRIDLSDARGDALDRLIELGALDVESSSARRVAAVMPDGVTPERIAHALGAAVDDIAVSRAQGRDADSVWILDPHPIQIGSIRIVPARMPAAPGAVRLVDAPAFGTGLHPTTALCLEALEEAVQGGSPDSLLDVGTGSGVLALAALMLGVPRAVAIDIDDDAMRVAMENARLNGAGERLQLARAGPEALAGTWPLVLANVLAAPLIEMAPVLVRRIGHHGRLVLSGIPASVEPDVHAVYRRLGLQRLGVKSRRGWVAIVLQASW